METNSVNQALLQDIWQKIPQEEKNEAASRAQSTATSTIFILLMFGWAMAVGMREQWYFWGTFLIVPFAFQVATSKAWHAQKPKFLVEHTAARAAACFYAQQCDGKHLVPSVQFRGLLERPSSEERHIDTDQRTDEEQLSEADTSGNEIEEVQGPVLVWVALFPDSLVIFSETPFGSQREFAHNTSEEISVSADDMEEDFGNQRRLAISVRDETGVEKRWVLSSKHDAHLALCQRKLLKAMERRQTLIAQAALAERNAAKHEALASLEG